MATVEATEKKGQVVPVSPTTGNPPSTVNMPFFTIKSKTNAMGELLLWKEIASFRKPFLCGFHIGQLFGGTCIS